MTDTPAARQAQCTGVQVPAAGPYTEDDFVLGLCDAEVPGTADAFTFFFGGDGPEARTFT
ncbi:hypothetical protein ACH4FX_22810 [Streptomyces sp. NPDC018019]|uniref:hypothetical protein n=1 Tax=Streptomyces sp. NPDC018019 TaxID=3365030 RepID=UPI003788F535